MLATTLPLVPDRALRERLRGAGQLAYDAWLLDGDASVFRRAGNEVASYFRWLRWNLVLALDGEQLPDELPMPVLGRPIDEPAWLSPSEVPSYT